jgi:hypothetical protein
VICVVAVEVEEPVEANRGALRSDAEGVRDGHIATLGRAAWQRQQPGSASDAAPPGAGATAITRRKKTISFKKNIRTRVDACCCKFGCMARAITCLVRQISVIVTRAKVSFYEMNCALAYNFINSYKRKQKSSTDVCKCE